MALAGDRVADPDLRTKLIDSWVEIQSNKLGKDTGAREYFDMVKAISREVDYTSIEIYRYGYVNKYDGLELQKRLSARITAQREVALLLEPDIKITAKDFELSQLFGASGQAVATLLEYDKKLNRDFIVFLSEPVTDSSISDLHESLIAAGSGTGVSTEFLKRQGILDRINHRSLLHLHKNFWGEPLVWPSSPRF